MIVRCCSLTVPSDILPARLQQFQGRWPVTLRAEYQVLKLGQRDGLWYVTFEHLEREMPVSAPLALFEIVDGRVPHFWNVRMRGNEVSLQPIEFDDEFFVDDVQERRDDALKRYQEMKARS